METKPQVYDVAVIGGGIAGAGVARDAALRGFSVVLLEKNLFGSGTSSKSSKLIHGGIRYLELSWKALKKLQLIEAWRNFWFVLHSLKESRTLVKIAPGLVRPIPLLIPVYKNDRRAKRSVYFGTQLYYFLSLFSGPAKKPIEYRDKSEVLRVLPELQAEDLIGGFTIWDHLTDDLGLVKATIRSAQNQGALCLEMTEVLSYYSVPDGFYKIECRKEGQNENFQARAIVNASGPWVDKVKDLGGKASEPFLSPVAGSHIEFNRFLPCSVILQGSDGRVFFAVDLGSKTRVGTTEWVCPDPDHVPVPEADVDYLINSLNRYFPKLRLKKEEIVNSDAGIRPLPHSPKGANEISREHEIRETADGVLHLLGVKLTDHRRAAADVVNRLVKKIEKSGGQKKCRTHKLTL